MLERRHLGVELGVVVARFHAQPVERLIVGGILILVIVLRGLRRRVPVLRVGIGGGIVHVLIRGRGLKRAARLSRHGLRRRVCLGLGIGVHVALDIFGSERLVGLFLRVLIGRTDVRVVLIHPSAVTVEILAERISIVHRGLVRVIERLKVAVKLVPGCAHSAGVFVRPALCGVGVGEAYEICNSADKFIA